MTVKCPSCEVTLSVEVGGNQGDLVRKLTGNRLLNVLKQQHANGEHGGEQ